MWPGFHAALLEGVSHERARCLRGILPLNKPRWLSTFGRSGLKARSHRISAPVNEDPDQRGFGQSCLLRSSNSKHKLCYCSQRDREIEIRRVAVLMINRYADEAKANSDRRAEELRPKGEYRRSAPKLGTDGDHADAAIWRRGTVAIRAAYRHDGTTALIMVRSLAANSRPQSLGPRRSVFSD